MENEILANEKILTLNRESSSFKILNAMLNSINGPEYEGTKKTVIEDILNAQDLEEIAAINDDCFLMPMRARGVRPRSSRPSSATERVQTLENSDSN